MNQETTTKREPLASYSAMVNRATEEAGKAIRAAIRRGMRPKVHLYYAPGDLLCTEDEPPEGYKLATAQCVPHWRGRETWRAWITMVSRSLPCMLTDGGSDR